ncbi:MAG: hypothetical protein M1840_004831 [Geoglossum simile]|nr:MAG: hypothetical protein M1840_004831 [Geoglossum simile]
MALPPDQVVVGVDLGMTYTGVAICSPDSIEHDSRIVPSVIQQWPGCSDSVASKVPTLVAYRAGAFSIHSWGFECPPIEEVGLAMSVKGLFKFLLDENRLEHMNQLNPLYQEKIANVKGWFKDFLTALHDYIAAYLEDVWHVDWNSTKVEYIFSLPTLWKDDDTLIQSFDAVVKLAFKPGENRSVAIGMTEGEACAIYTAKRIDHKYEKGDSLIVCDAGGGTTDICALKVENIDGETVELVKLDEPQVAEAGSVQIDQAFEEKVGEQLGALEQQHAIPKYAAHFLAKGREFQDIKTSFGGPNANVQSIYYFRVPGLPDSSATRIHLTRDELKAMFDEEMGKIFEFIDLELEELERNGLGLTVSHFILSGGLGSSAYVQREIKARYEQRGMTVLADTDPQEPPVAVCKGLVLDRMQRICYGTSVLRTRCCRASYGILQDEKYKKDKHEEQTPFKCPFNGKSYVPNRIYWIISKGKTINEDTPIKHKIRRRIGLEDSSNGWEDIVVISKFHPDCLPQYLDQGDSRPVCRLLSNLGQGSQAPGPPGVTTKRKSLIGKKYLQVDYELLVYFEQESLRFEVRVIGEEQGESKTVKAEWIFEDGQLAHGTREGQLQKSLPIA